MSKKCDDAVDLALIASIQGERGQPRSWPLNPAVEHLLDQPSHVGKYIGWLGFAEIFGNVVNEN